MKGIGLDEESRTCRWIVFFPNKVVYVATFSNILHMENWKSHQ